MSRLIHEELSRDILAAAMQVHSTLKPGLDEKLYENALVIELAKRGHRADQQKSFSVHYDGHFIGKMTPDLIVDDLVIVDSKVVDEFNKDHFAQMLGYLSITGLGLAMLINFKHASLRWKRIIKSSAEPDDDVVLWIRTAPKKNPRQSVKSAVAGFRAIVVDSEGNRIALHSSRV